VVPKTSFSGLFWADVLGIQNISEFKDKKVGRNEQGGMENEK